MIHNRAGNMLKICIIWIYSNAISPKFHSFWCIPIFIFIQRPRPQGFTKPNMKKVNLHLLGATRQLPSDAPIPPFPSQRGGGAPPLRRRRRAPTPRQRGRTPLLVRTGSSVRLRTVHYHRTWRYSTGYFIHKNFVFFVLTFHCRYTANFLILDRYSVFCTLNNVILTAYDREGYIFMQLPEHKYLLYGTSSSTLLNTIELDFFKWS